MALFRKYTKRYLFQIQTWKSSFYITQLSVFANADKSLPLMQYFYVYCLIPLRYGIMREYIVREYMV